MSLLERMPASDAAIHPRSRKAAQIQRKNNRRDKLTTEGKQRRKAKFLPEVIKMKWFRDNTTEGTVYDDAEVRTLIKKYLEEKQAELDLMKSEKNKNVWKISSQQALVDRETLLFEEGRFTGPDITAKKVMKKLHSQWDGRNADYLDQIRSRIYKPKASPDDPNELIKMPAPVKMDE